MHTDRDGIMPPKCLQTYRRRHNNEPWHNPSDGLRHQGKGKCNLCRCPHIPTQKRTCNRRSQRDMIMCARASQNRVCLQRCRMPMPGDMWYMMVRLLRSSSPFTSQPLPQQYHVKASMTGPEGGPARPSVPCMPEAASDPRSS